MIKWFGRSRSQDDAGVGDVHEEPGQDSASTSDGSEGARGPWDADERPELGRRIDLGALRIPGRSGMQVRMELEKATRRIVAVNVSLDGSALQIQAFAAPRSSGLWEELREEIVSSIDSQGGSAETVEGPFGVELLARLPVKTPDGRSGHRPARFIGVDGPRWFLRAVMTGAAVDDAERAATMEELLGDVVVVRGTEARAPRDLLVLHMPGRPGEEVAAPAATRPRTLDLGAPKGPEITEVN